MEYKILITDRLKIAAETIARNRIKFGLYNRFSCNDNERFEHAYVGAIGEVAFDEILTINEINYETDIYTSDRPDSGDFFIPNKDGLIIDVKIAKIFKEPEPKWMFGIPVDQKPWEKDLIIIGYWNPSTDWVIFYGSIKGNHMMDRSVVLSNSLTHKRYFTPNVELCWEELDRKVLQLNK